MKSRRRAARKKGRAKAMTSTASSQPSTVQKVEFHAGVGPHMDCEMPGRGPIVNMKMLTPMLVTTMMADESASEAACAMPHNTTAKFASMKKHNRMTYAERPSGIASIANTRISAATLDTSQTTRKHKVR